MLIDIFSLHRKFDILQRQDLKILQDLNCPITQVVKKI